MTTYWEGVSQVLNDDYNRLNHIGKLNDSFKDAYIDLLRKVAENDRDFVRNNCERHLSEVILCQM